MALPMTTMQPANPQKMPLTTASPWSGGLLSGGVGAQAVGASPLSMQATQATPGQAPVARMMSAQPIAQTGNPTGGVAAAPPTFQNGNTQGNQAAANTEYNAWLSQQQTALTSAGYSQGQITAMLNPYVKANQLANSSVNDYGTEQGYIDSGNSGSSIQNGNSANQNQNMDSLDYNTYDKQVLGGTPSSYTDNGITYSPYVAGWNSSMALAGKYQQQVDANSSGFNTEKAESEGAGPTGWASAERLRQNALSMQARDAGAQQVGGQTAQADDALAAQGGLSSGARERVAEGGAKNYTSMEQGVDQSALNNDLSIGTTDQQNKLSMLSNVASQENTRSSNWMQANQYDQQQQTAEAQRLQAWNNMTTQQQNQAYAANQMSNATANAGSSSPW